MPGPAATPHDRARTTRRLPRVAALMLLALLAAGPGGMPTSAWAQAKSAAQKEA